MEDSAQRRVLSWQASLTTLEVVSLLGLPTSLLALARGHADLAVATAVAVTLASSTRAFAIGLAIEASLRRGWQRAVKAARRRSVVVLRSRPETEESVTMLMDAVHETAMVEASTYPHIAALSLALGALTVAVVVMLGPLWLAVGAVGLGLGGGFVAFSHSRLRPVQERAWRKFGELVLDFRVLCDASAELRAHGREETFSRALLDRAGEVARAERAVSSWAAVTSMLPAALAILALAAPVRAGVTWASEVLASERVADVGVLGAAALMLGLSLVSNVQSLQRSRPLRATLASFLAEAAQGDAAQARQGTGRVDVEQVEIALEGVSFVHEGAEQATPRRASVRWPAGIGLAVTGENGAGKSTLALMMLGLLRPIEGRISFGGHELSDLDLEALRSELAYLPQNAFVATGISVAWHLRLFAKSEVSDEQIDRALERVGLLATLASHARRTGCAPREVVAGELSGGERQRMNLARALVQQARWVLLDEPEAGLDTAGRRQLHDLLTELAAERRVLLIAHDESVIPPPFVRLQCTRGPLGAPEPAG